MITWKVGRFVAEWQIVGADVTWFGCLLMTGGVAVLVYLRRQRILGAPRRRGSSTAGRT